MYNCNWAQAIINAYDILSTTVPSPDLEPLDHLRITSSYIITIDEKGNFKKAEPAYKYLSEKIVTKNRKNGEEKISITPAHLTIPVTPASASRGSGFIPHPLTDVLSCIAGDFDISYGKKDLKQKEVNTRFNQYKSGLEKWANSEYSHPAVKAILSYISKSTVMADLQKSGLIPIKGKPFKDPITGNEEADIEKYLSKASIDSCFVNFIIDYDDPNREKYTWEDESLREAFGKYLRTQLKADAENPNNEDVRKAICSITGKEDYALRIQPRVKEYKKFFSKNSDKKEISQYCGTWNGPDSIMSNVGYEASQRLHLGARYLINTCDVGSFFGLKDMNYLIWENNYNGSFNWLTDLELTKSEPNNTEQESNEIKSSKEKSGKEYVDIELSDASCDALGDMDDEKFVDSYAHEISATIKGKYDLEAHEHDMEYVNILSLESMNPGRLAVTGFSKLSTAEFCNNIKKWYANSAVPYYKRGKKDSNDEKSGYRTRHYNLSSIVKYAYGREKTPKEFDVKDGIKKNALLHLIPCIIEGRPIPVDIMNSAISKVSKPESYHYDPIYDNHNNVVMVAYSLIQSDIKRKGGHFSMKYDNTNTDRSYLFGCLLAIAYQAEIDAFKGRDNKREPNARRLWSKFCTDPAYTWTKLEEKLNLHLKKLGYNQYKWYQDHIDEIMNNFKSGDFEMKKRLSPAYILGYHQFRSYISEDLYTKSVDKASVSDEPSETSTI